MTIEIFITQIIVSFSPAPPTAPFVCLLRASVKGGYVIYIDPSYGYGKASDIYGNRASPRWDPMTCPTGDALPRRIYSPRRVKGAYVKEGFYEWYKAGFPRDPVTGAPPERYFRGKADLLPALKGGGSL